MIDANWFLRLRFNQEIGREHHELMMGAGWKKRRHTVELFFISNGLYEILILDKESNYSKTYLEEFIRNVMCYKM